MKETTTQLHRLQVQGVENIDQQTINEVGSWLRLAYLTCAILAGIGTLLAAPIFLWALVPLAAAGALSAVHPIDWVYNTFIRRFTGTQSLPKRGVPARFACGVGSILLIVTGFAFYSGATTAGYILGASLFAVAFLVGTTDICIPSIIFRLATGRSDMLMSTSTHSN